MPRCVLVVVLLTILSTTGSLRPMLQCVPCEDGFYLDDSALAETPPGDAVCVHCPAFMTTVPDRNASDVRHCICGTGYYVESGPECLPCERGTHKDFIGNSTCNECPALTDTAGGAAVEVTECLCEPGAGLEAIERTLAYEDVSAQAVLPVQVGVVTRFFGPAGHPMRFSTAPGWQSDSSNDYADMDVALGVTIITVPSGFTGPLYYYCAAHSAMYGQVLLLDDYLPCTLCQPGQSKSTLLHQYCDTCPPNTFCATEGLLEPVDCAEHSTSAAGSDHISDCLCAVGYEAVFAWDGTLEAFSHVCSECGVGKYSDVVNTTQCSDCPVGTYLGSTGNDALEDCQACDPNAQSAVGSDAVTDCVCNLGYAGQPGDECVACAPGEYRSDTEEYICRQCPAGTYNGLHASSTVDDCSECPVNTNSPAGSTALLDCVCNAGFSAAEAGDQYVCTACTAGYFQAASNQTACDACPAGTFSTVEAATAADVCTTCEPGFFALTVGNDACQACPSNTFQDSALADPAAQPCTTCPDNSTHSLTNSTEITDCRCVAGFAQRGDGANPADPHRCDVCRAGYYCPGDGDEFICAFNHYSEEGSTECTPCAENSQALSPNIVTVDECKCVAGAEGSYDANCTLCNPGFYASDPNFGACQRCPAGNYSVGRGNTECAACPLNSNSIVGSDALTDCLCNPGFYGPDGGQCQQCPENKTCPGGNVVNDCRLHSSGPAGSSEEAQCSCDPGYYSTTSTAACQKCPAGSYCPGGLAVEPCAEKASSVAGSSQITACHCNAGHWRGCILSTDTMQYVDANGAPCTIDYAAACQVCPEDTVCFNETLLHCPDHSETDPGSSDPDTCICIPGYKREDAIH